MQALPSVAQALEHSSLPHSLTGECHHHDHHHNHDNVQAADNVFLANSFADPWRNLRRQLLLRPPLQTYSGVLQGGRYVIHRRKKQE